MVVRLGIPPLDIIPGFQVKFLSGGIICADCPNANCEVKRLAKIRTDVPSIPDGLKCEIRHFILSLRANLFAPGIKPCLFGVMSGNTRRARSGPRSGAVSRRDGPCRGRCSYCRPQRPAGLAGITATSVASITDDPSTLFCINKTSPSAARMGVFCINTLAFSREALAVQLFLLPAVLFFTPFFVQAASSGPFLRSIFLRRPFSLASLF